MAENDSQTEKPRELTSAQRKIIPHLLAARTIEDAAQAGGVSERTLYRWLNEPLFRAEVARAETDAIDYTVRRLLRLQDKALDTLTAVLDDPKVAAGVRVRAALGLISSLIELRALRNMDARITALEQLYYGDEDAARL